MTTAYTSLLGFALPVEGELDGTWGDVVNGSITELVEDAIAATATASVSSGDWTLTTTGSGAVNQARCAILIPTGSPGVTRNIIAPSSSKAYIVDNQSNAAVVVKGSATTGTSIAAGAKALVVWTGTDFAAVATSTGTGVTSVSGTGTVQGLTLSGTVTSTGSLTLGGSLSAVSLASQVSGTLPLANGGTGGTDAATARSSLGATTVGGNFFTLTNPSAITFTRINADNTVSALNAADFRTAIGVSTGAGTVTSVSGAGTVNGLTLTGTVTSSGSLTLGGTLSGVALASQVTGTLPVANGGTGQTTYIDGQLLIGNSTGNTLTKATLTAGSGISITNGSGSITIAATGGGGSGTVTSVGLTMPSGFSVGSSPVTTSGTIAVTTSLSGVLKGTGSGFTAAVAGTDYVTPTGTETLTNKTLTNPTITNYTETTYTANTGTAITLDLANGTIQVLTLTGNATVTMPTATAGKSFVVELKTGVGGFTCSFSGVKWPSGTSPTVTSTASRMDIFSFFADGTNWYGVTVGQNYIP